MINHAISAFITKLITTDVPIVEKPRAGLEYTIKPTVVYIIRISMRNEG